MIEDHLKPEYVIWSVLGLHILGDILLVHGLWRDRRNLRDTMNSPIDYLKHPAILRRYIPLQAAALAIVGIYELLK